MQLGPLVYRLDFRQADARPLIDPQMVWTYGPFRNLGAGIQVPEEAAEIVSKSFRETAATLQSEPGRVAYAERIRASAGEAIAEDENLLEGSRIAMVWNDEYDVQVVLLCRPVY